MSVRMSTHTRLCVYTCACLCICTHTFPGEIRLLCQWCRSSSMINSPACWKQCYSALATCGTPVQMHARFSVCAWNSRNINPNILFRTPWCCKYVCTQVNHVSVQLGLVYNLAVYYSLVLPVMWLWQAQQTWKKTIRVLQRCVYHLLKSVSI